MATNIEIKARVENLDRVQRILGNLSDSTPEEILQEDTFFKLERGRLKLRDFGDGRGELIFYERDDAPGPRPSHYLIFPTTDPDRLGMLLTVALGEVGVVRKKRTLYWVGSTRIHLDEVEDLGTFVEIEVVLGPSETEGEGEAAAQALMERLGVRTTDLVGRAYVDLLKASP